MCHLLLRPCPTQAVLPRWRNAAARRRASCWSSCPCLSPHGQGIAWQGWRPPELMGHFNSHCAFVPGSAHAGCCLLVLFGFGADNKDFLRKHHQGSGPGPCPAWLIPSSSSSSAACSSTPRCWREPLARAYLRMLLSPVPGSVGGGWCLLGWLLAGVAQGAAVWLEGCRVKLSHFSCNGRRRYQHAVCAPARWHCPDSPLPGRPYPRDVAAAAAGTARRLAAATVSRCCFH